MIDKEFIDKRMRLIRRYGEELDRVLEAPDEAIRQNFREHYTLERLLQLIVDEIIDINNHIIRHDPRDLETPDDFQSAFRRLSDAEILPEELAKRLAPVVGLRNRLIHRYEEIDIDTMIHTIRRERSDFNEYIAAINRYIAGE